MKPKKQVIIYERKQLMKLLERIAERIKNEKQSNEPKSK